eukprot:TRINITY_DN1669_c0_g1_i1.p1 TRINITY_DN1669_c0_g1~~TRINITY_DN1669_c0_g1_i1.p1  ORF type:complete len:359 (-),score=76.63 TRINITY_DN1669_c0_g1_i1:1096-2172(-)
MSTDSRKRKAEDQEENALIPAAKRQRTDLIVVPDAAKQEEKAPGRTSKLQAPIMMLSGHESDVLAVRFSPDGNSVASASKDKDIFLWNTYEECKNYLMLRGHKGAVLDLSWQSDNNAVYSASSDKSVGVWDAHTGKRMLRLSEHAGIVNAVAGQRKSTQQFVSASDDGAIKVWDTRNRQSAMTVTGDWPLTSVAFHDQHNYVFSGGLENEIFAWDLRLTKEPVFVMAGHADTITSLRIDPRGEYILSNSMDSTVRIWDIRPYFDASNGQSRCVKLFIGAIHNMDKNLLRAAWSGDGSYVAAGAADKSVYVWDVTTRQIKYRLPGHNGPVNDVDFHPTEPILASCAADRKIFLGELEEN